MEKNQQKYIMKDLKESVSNFKMSKHITLIGDLVNTKHEVSIKVVTDNSKKGLSDSIFDFSQSLKKRMKCITIFYDTYGQEESIEIINRLATMYQFSGTKILEKYLYEICTNCSISSFLKITVAKSLCYFDQEREFGYKALDYVCQNMINVATPCQIDTVCLLMNHSNYKQEARNYFCKIINDEKIDCDYRYKTILSLENKEIKDFLYFFKESSLEFFKNDKNRTMYRILAGHVLIQKCKLPTTEIENIEFMLISFAQDNELDYNLRADAADVILRVGSDKNKLTARKIIMILGTRDGVVKTIFDNAQNVHVNEIEESVLEALEFLSSIEIKPISGVRGTEEIGFEYVKKQIDNITKKEKENKKDKINISLNRIYLDRALYSKYNCTLLNILLKVWTYIKTHESEDDMTKRLVEELVDMSGTCSSGFASRLINVISGFGDFNLRISWKDQIIANFTGRMNAKIREIANSDKKIINFNMYEIIKDKENISSTEEQLETFQEKVLEEITISSNHYESRPNFLTFFRKNMLSIREELYTEFKSHIPSNDFDLYFRDAISLYETGGYV
jgi:hypothetical protein